MWIQSIMLSVTNYAFHTQIRHYGRLQWHTYASKENHFRIEECDVGLERFKSIGVCYHDLLMYTPKKVT